MPRIESGALVSPMVREAVYATGTITDAHITRDYGRKDETFQRWQVIEDQLIDWGRSPSQFEDADIQPLSKDTIRLAIEFAKESSMADWPPPTRVVPDADAGIVFELQHGKVFETYRFSADGGVEYCVFEDARLVNSTVWPPRYA